jgi:hypothetical protein
MAGNYISAKERFVRALLLLAASTVFSAIAYWAGLSKVTDQNYVYGGIFGIILAAVIVSRFGAKFVVRWWG